MTSLRFPEVIVDKDHLAITGIAHHPLAFYKTSDVNTQAKENVSLAISGESTPIFLGIAHLKYLNEIWPTSRPAIVIAKYSSFAADILNEQMEFLNQNKNIYVCSCNLAFSSPLSNPTFNRINQMQEIGLLALQLMKTPDDIWNNSILYSDEPQSIDVEFSVRLFLAILAVQNAKAFHISHNAIYEEINNLKSELSVGILARKNDNLLTAMSEFGEIFTSNDKIPYRFNDIPLSHSDIFYGIDKTNLKDLQGRYKKYVAPYVGDAINFLAYLQKHNPQILTCRNMSPFCTLEHLLIHREIIIRCGKPLYYFFRDLFSNQTFGFEGGWNFYLHTEHLMQEQDKIFSHDEFDSQYNLSTNTKSHYFPFRYVSGTFNNSAPVAAEIDCDHDISIIHTARQISILAVEIAELYETLNSATNTANTVNLIERTSINFFIRMRRLAAEMPALKHYSYLSAINYIEWIFYAQHRIRRVVDIVTATPTHSIKVYGDGWEKILPANVCGGSLSQQRANEIYRTSKITINCTTTKTLRLPHASAIYCLNSGGFPLVPYPSHPEHTGLGFDFFNNKTLPYYRDTNELVSLVDFYLSNWNARQDFIKNARSTWLKKLHDEDLFTSKDLFNFPIESKWNENIKITEDSTLDDNLIHVGTGYLHCLSGYFHLALQSWHIASEDQRVCSKQLLNRAIKCAQAIKSKEMEKHFFTKLESFYKINEPIKLQQEC